MKLSNPLRSICALFAFTALLAAPSIVRADDTKPAQETKPAMADAKTKKSRSPKAPKAEKAPKAATNENVSVTLNSATATELNKLPGIGPAIAERILSYRAEKGKFTEIGQLLEIKGIGEKKLALIRPHVTLD
jgi:competence protein ComEA